MSILSGEITLNNSPNYARFNESFVGKRLRTITRTQIAIDRTPSRAIESRQTIVDIVFHKLADSLG